MADVKVWCNNHAQYLEIISSLNRLDYTWADGVLLPSYDPFLDAAHASDDFKYAIHINRDAKTISFGFSDVNTISVAEFLQFTKADLEDGMIVRNASGRYYMYFKKFDKLISHYLSLDTRKFNSDLTHTEISIL